MFFVIRVPHADLATVLTKRLLHISSSFSYNGFLPVFAARYTCFAQNEGEIICEISRTIIVRTLIMRFQENGQFRTFYFGWGGGVSEARKIGNVRGH